MAKLASLLSFLTICLLIVFSAQATQPSQRQSQCNIQNINALEPNQRLQSEAGITELWNEDDNQLECAGVAMIRYTIQPRGLLLPHYHNAPKLTYVIQGRGMHGLALSGCPETFQSSSQQQSQEREQQGESQQQQRFRESDQHQKVQQIRQGDIVAIPNGVPAWFYNEGESPLVLVALIDTSNNENQLDNYRRSFYLAGNPQQLVQQQQGQQGQSPYQGRGSQQQQDQMRIGNIFQGMDDQMLAEAFGVSTDTVRKMRGENDNRGTIVRVENGLQTIRPPRREQQQWEQQQEQGLQQEQQGNGVEESTCNMKLRLNIDNPSRADIYNPQAGRINRINSRNLPILRAFQLNAERGVLYRNALNAPHFHQNAHSVVYVTRGTAQVQIVGNYQQPIFDGELRQGQVLVVPQNFAVVARAGNNGFEWVSFKTNDNVVNNALAGRNSAIRALPQEVLMNAFRISSQEAWRLKFNREEEELFAPRFQSQQRAFA
ncbi:hypothetical protein ACHQM5_012179 [Ranunculus cassubicifolius]